jgi:hypothetical protein
MAGAPWQRRLRVFTLLEILPPEASVGGKQHLFRTSHSVLAISSFMISLVPP